MPPSDPVFQIGDLAAWERPGTGLAVFGQPIAHSLSPPMHTAALAALARDDRRFEDWSYHRFEIAPADMPAALRLAHAAGFRGLNLTIPHKVIAFGLSAVDARARPTGAVNTLVRTDSGWAGYNTDGYGLSEAVREGLGLELAGARVLLLGAGGAARGAAIECLERGCSGLWLWNRTPGNLESLAALVRAAAGRVPVALADGPMSPGSLPPGLLVVNATSAGLHPSDPAPIDLAGLARPAGVLDMVYNPPDTALLRQARGLAIPAKNGLSMLVHQGAKALELWTGIPASRTAPVMAEAARRAAGG